MQKEPGKNISSLLIVLDTMVMQVNGLAQAIILFYMTYEFLMFILCFTIEIKAHNLEL